MSAPPLRFPDLDPPFDAALRDAVAFVLDRFDPIGVLACGTIVGGNPDPASDLDLYVLHRAPWRQRLQKFFQDVPTEIFVNPPGAVRGYLETERLRPQSAHMMATGFEIFSSDPIIATLRAEAQQAIATAPALGDEASTRERYTGALLVEDATDVISRDPDMASLLAGEAVTHAARLRFRLAGHFVPRHKDLLCELDGLDPELAREARAFFASADAHDRLARASRIADAVFGARGFFEWESSEDPVEDA